MKVTVKPESKKEVCEIPFDKIPIGSVYEVSDGAVLLKVTATDAIIFAGNGGCDFFGMAHSYKTFSAAKILGKLTEIIVEEE